MFYIHQFGAKFELYFWYKDNKQRKLAKETLNSAIIDYSKSIEIALSQEQTDKIEIERNFDSLDLGEHHFYRGNAYSWLDNTGRKACNDWKISKNMAVKMLKKMQGSGDANTIKNYIDQYLSPRRRSLLI